MSEHRRVDRQRGTAAIELVVGVALLMVPMAMIVLSFAPLLEARTFVRLASAELARTVAITDGDEVTAYRSRRRLLIDKAGGSGVAAHSIHRWRRGGGLPEYPRNGRQQRA